MASLPKNTWGIFTQDGVAVFDVDSVIDLHYTNSSKVSTFPVEKGAFTSYNKVKTPFKTKVRLSVGGDSNRISSFISTMDAVVDDTNLYNIVTPEAVYLNVNVEHISYGRGSEKGANLIMADLEIIEIRQTQPQYTTVTLPPTKVKRPGDASKQNTGKKNGEPTPEDLSKLTPAQVIQRARDHAAAAAGLH